MDSRLGQYGISKFYLSQRVTLDLWVVQTPATLAVATGFQCYYSGVCRTPTEQLVTATGSPSGGTSSKGHLSQAALIVLIIGIILIFLAGIGAFVYIKRRRQRNDQNDEALTELLIQHLLQLLNPRRPQTQNDTAMTTALRNLENRMEAIDRGQQTLVGLVQRFTNQTSTIPNTQVQDTLEQTLGSALECAICTDILYNPVAVITDQNTSGRPGCCELLHNPPLIAI